MGRNFKVRLSVSLLLLIIAAIFLFTFDGVPFKIFFGTFAIIAAIELLSFFRNFTASAAKPAPRTKLPLCIMLALIEIFCLFAGTLFIAKQDTITIIIVILGVCGYDVFAYLFGSWLGGRIFGSARPFPHISKNKTWEGTILGLITAFLLVAFTSLAAQTTGSYDANFLFSIIPFLALIGDLFESLLKRQFNVKDSNEIVIKTHLFTKLELLVGGSEGHGGYLDRIDSIAFTTTAILVLLTIL